MLLMVKQGIRGGICHAIHQYAKGNNKFMKGYEKSKESSYLKYWYVNNLYGWAISQKLPVNNFKWIEDTSKFNEDFTKSYNEESDEGYFLKIYVQYLKNYMNFIIIYHFYQKEWKFKKSKRLLLIYMIKTEYDIHIRNLKQALNLIKLD